MIRKIKEKIMHYAWDLAYGVYDEKILINGIKNVKLNYIKNPYKNKWFADPFILEEDNEFLQLLVEEFDYDVKRGRIARIRIDKRSNLIIECSIVLDLPTHLSFPVIYHIGDKVYVNPENSESGSSYTYRYDQNIDKLIERQLLVKEPVTDAIITEEKEGYAMYATKVPDPNGNRLYKYISQDFFGPYKNVSNDVYPNNTARMAGMFIKTNDSLIRPAQDCHGEYGKAVIMYKGHNQLCRLEPLSYKYSGIHTCNTNGSTFIIDLKKNDYPLLYKLIKMVKK